MSAVSRFFKGVNFALDFEWRIRESKLRKPSQISGYIMAFHRARTATKSQVFKVVEYNSGSDYAEVAKLADALASGASGGKPRGGSSPLLGTNSMVHTTA